MISSVHKRAFFEISLKAAVFLTQHFKRNSNQLIIFVGYFSHQLETALENSKNCQLAALFGLTRPTGWAAVANVLKFLSCLTLRLTAVYYCSFIFKRRVISNTQHGAATPAVCSLASPVR